MSFFDAFNQTQPAPEHKPLPAGIYQARVLKGELIITKKGEDAYRITFEVTDGEHQGRKVFRTWTFSAKALAYSKRDLAMFQLTTSQHLLEPFPELGREVYCRFMMAVQRGDDGTEFNDMKRIDMIRFVESPAKHFLIDQPPPVVVGGF